MPELTLFEKGLGYLSPKLAMERVADREALKEFAGSSSVRARGQDATLFEQASPEGWKKQRDRIKAIWEGRAMEEKLCLGFPLRSERAAASSFRLYASSFDGRRRMFLSLPDALGRDTDSVLAVTRAAHIAS